MSSELSWVYSYHTPTAQSHSLAFALHSLFKTGFFLQCADTITWRWIQFDMYTIWNEPISFTQKTMIGSLLLGPVLFLSCVEQQLNESVFWKQRPGILNVQRRRTGFLCFFFYVHTADKSVRFLNRLLSSVCFIFSKFIQKVPCVYFFLFPLSRTRHVNHMEALGLMTSRNWLWHSFGVEPRKKQEQGRRSQQQWNSSLKPGRTKSKSNRRLLLHFCPRFLHPWLEGRPSMLDFLCGRKHQAGPEIQWETVSKVVEISSHKKEFG